MKNILSLFATTCIATGTIVNSININQIHTKHNIIHKSNSNDWRKYDLSKLAFKNKSGVDHDESKWNPVEPKDNDFNITYADIAKDKPLSNSIQQDMYMQLSSILDNKLKSQEEDLFKTENIFSTEAVSPMFNYVMTMSVLNKNKESTEVLNEPFNSLKTVKLITLGNMASFYIRLSNSMNSDWTVNKSYLDFTVNVCHFPAHLPYTLPGDLSTLNKSNQTFSSFDGNDNEVYALSTGMKTFKGDDLDYESLCPEWHNLDTFLFYMGTIDIKFRTVLNIHYVSNWYKGAGRIQDSEMVGTSDKISTGTPADAVAKEVTCNGKSYWNQSANIITPYISTMWGVEPFGIGVFANIYQTKDTLSIQNNMVDEYWSTDRCSERNADMPFDYSCQWFISQYAISLDYNNNVYN